MHDLMDDRIAAVVDADVGRRHAVDVRQTRPQPLSAVGVDARGRESLLRGGDGEGRRTGRILVRGEFFDVGQAVLPTDLFG